MTPPMKPRMAGRPRALKGPLSLRMAPPVSRSAAAPDLPGRRLRDVVRVSGALAGAVDPSEVIAAVLDTVIQLFDLEACSIGLLDPSGETLAFSISRGRAKTDAFEMPAGTGIAGWVAKTGRGVVCNDVTKDPRFYRGVDQRSGFRTRALLCAPLRHDGRVLGVIEAMNPADPEGFPTSDLRFLTAFGTVVAAALERTREISALREQHAALSAAAGARYELVTGASQAMTQVLKVAKRAASSAATVLLLGESGSGKEVVARAIHRWSPRADAPFVAVNCTALTQELLESELFGHERGAFTGAVAQKKGRFELADGGTIFLDEIGDLAPALQAKLLRVLQEKEIQRVGGERDIPVDVRVIAATNRDLRAAVRAGSFRKDLFYRLNVVTVELPPLRERRGDVPVLARHFVDHYCQEVGRTPLTIAPAVLETLESYEWPGNVRELQNAIERAVVLAPGPELELEDLPRDLRDDSVDGAGDGAESIPDAMPLREAIDAFTRQRIRYALAAARGQQTEAAHRLGLPQSNLSRLMKRLGLR
jgi:Nif-specific regulatory protein